MSIFNAVCKSLTPRAGAIAAFLLGSATGGIFFSENFSMQKGDFLFTTNDDDNAMQLLQESYKDRQKHLLERSKKNLAEFQSEELSVEAKKELVQTTVDFYLTPTSHDKLFSKDIVIFNGKGKPTILTRADYNEILDNWVKILSIADVKKCVDQHRVGENYSCYDRSVAVKACRSCMSKFADSLANKIEK